MQVICQQIWSLKLTDGDAFAEASRQQVPLHLEWGVPSQMQLPKQIYAS